MGRMRKQTASAFRAARSEAESIKKLKTEEEMSSYLCTEAYQGNLESLQSGSVNGFELFSCMIVAPRYANFMQGLNSPVIQFPRAGFLPYAICRPL